MNWDIDAELYKLEPGPGHGAGTSITRVMADLKFMKSNGVEPTPLQLERDGGMIWCVGLGFAWAPKAFFYGQTIYEAVQKARKAAKQDKLAEHTPWGVQNFYPKSRQKPYSRKE